MLIYHPAFDIHHCIFRTLLLLNEMPKSAYEIDRIKILDFCLLFPYYLKQVRFPSNARRYKNALPQLNPYDKLEDPRRILHRLTPYQLTALKCLASYNLIDSNMLPQGQVKRTDQETPRELTIALGRAKQRDHEILSILTSLFASIDLYGPDGLKARTDLLEHKYDTI